MADTRVTRQRRAIADALADTDAFLSAGALHAVLHQRGERIGLATVYRTLGRMAADGELDVLVGPDGETAYRRCSQGHHHHLVCRVCGHTVEVSGTAVEDWTRRVAREEGFVDVSHSLELLGKCADCAVSGTLDR